MPDKVLIPERYIESDPEEAPSPEQEADKQRKVDRIKALIAKNRSFHCQDFSRDFVKNDELGEYISSLLQHLIKCCVFPPSMQNVLPSLALSPEEDHEEEVTILEKEKMINISYELAAEASKRSKLVAGTSLERQQGHIAGLDQGNACANTKNCWQRVLLWQISCFHAASAQSFPITISIISPVVSLTFCINFCCLAFW